jgi:hypothetical protein
MFGVKSPSARPPSRGFPLFYGFSGARHAVVSEKCSDNINPIFENSPYFLP